MEKTSHRLTLQLASLEAKCWRKANMDDGEGDDSGSPAGDESLPLPLDP